MEIITRIERLLEASRTDSVVQENGTILLNPGKIPKCRHMIFKGLTDDVLREYLIADYKKPFPEEMATFLKQYNGCSLYWVRLFTNDRMSFAASLLSVYGLPMTPPFNRPKNQDEPFDIRIEDLGRHKNVPKHWLKFGSYIRDYQFEYMAELFYDTLGKKVYACYKNEDQILDQWDSMDDCLCSLMDGFSGSSLEYEVSF